MMEGPGAVGGIGSRRHSHPLPPKMRRRKHSFGAIDMRFVLCSCPAGFYANARLQRITARTGPKVLVAAVRACHVSAQAPPRAAHPYST